MGRPKNSKNIKKEVEMTVTQETPALSELEQMRTAMAVMQKELDAAKSAPKYEAKREISPDEQYFIDKQHTRGNVKKALAEKIDAQRDYDNQLVTGKFINRRAPGQTVKLPYYKHEGDVDKWYTFEDGKSYTIKRGFADQLNEEYYTPHFIQSTAPTEEGNAHSIIESVDTSQKKYAFFIGG